MSAPEFETRSLGARDLLAHVRIWDAQKFHPFAEGKVIAWTDRPTVVIEHADGTQSSWIAALPWERLDVPDGAS